MRIYLSFLSLIWLSISQAQTQEIGFMLGASNYHGDLAQKIVLKESHLSGGFFYRYNFDQYWTYRPTISYMQISANDANFKAYHQRNLSFKSEIIELANIVEFNYQPFSNSRFHQDQTFFALVGLAGMYYNPKALLNNEWHDLRPLNTENRGGGERYSRIQLTIPFGVGYKIALTDNFKLSAELCWRKTFTDYLDDVSTVYPNLNDMPELSAQLSDRSWEKNENGEYLSKPGMMRGDPNLKDWYLHFGVNISYRFTPIQCAF